MGFSVLKDPKDPRNFIVGPDVQVPLDAALLESGTAAADVQGLINRPAPRAFGPRGQAPQPDRFGGPGDPRQFRRGLINLEGRNLRRTFEQNKATFEAGLARDGLNFSAPGLREQLDAAYKSTRGFQAALEVAEDFFFAQPDQVAQREADREAIRQKETREANKLLAETQRIENENNQFKFDLGIPAQKMVEDRAAVGARMRIAGRIRDAMVLSEHFGTVRFGESTSSEKAVIKRSYENVMRELTVMAGKEAGAGALSDRELDFFEGFGANFGTLASLQDSERRVALVDAYNMMRDGANNIIQSNRALLGGARPMRWQDPDPRTVDQVLARELPPGLTLITPAEVSRIAEADRTRAELGQAGELGPITDERAAAIAEEQAFVPPDRPTPLLPEDQQPRVEEIPTAGIPLPKEVTIRDRIERERAGDPAAFNPFLVPRENPFLTAPETTVAPEAGAGTDFFEGIPELISEELELTPEEREARRRARGF